MTHPDRAIAAAGFRRRIYAGPGNFLRDLGRIARAFPTLLALAGRHGISAGFRERLMLVVTAVNRCRHCAYGHEILARHAGLAPAEISALLGLDLHDSPAQELAGLRYAIHSAEHDGRPNAEARAMLEACYGADVARQIDMACQLIQVGNRVGNSFDFLLSRLSRGRYGLLPGER